MSLILKSKPKTINFLRTIIQNPRDNKAAYRHFYASFATNTERRQWYENYLKAYTPFMNNLMREVTRIEDILKVLPNLSPWTLEQRFGIIKIGSVPSAFASESHLVSLIEKINRSGAVSRFKRIKRLECHLPDFRAAFPKVKKIDWFDLSARSRFLGDLMREKCGKPFVIKQDGRTYQITFLCNPYSSKMVFEIQTPEKEFFILKSSPYHFLNIRNDRVRKEHENMAIRADSMYSDALLEFYLKLNVPSKQNKQPP